MWGFSDYLFSVYRPCLSCCAAESAALEHTTKTKRSPFKVFISDSLVCAVGAGQVFCSFSFCCDPIQRGQCRIALLSADNCQQICINILIGALWYQLIHFGSPLGNSPTSRLSTKVQYAVAFDSLTNWQSLSTSLPRCLSPSLLPSLIEPYIVANKAVISADLIKSLLQQAALAAGLPRNTSHMKRQAARTAACAATSSCCLKCQEKSDYFFRKCHKQHNSSVEECLMLCLYLMSAGVICDSCVCFWACGNKSFCTQMWK